MPSLTAEELRGNRSQWLYAVDVLIETQGEVCLLPLPGDAAERLFPSVRFRVRERSRHKSALVMQKYSRQQAREAEQKPVCTRRWLLRQKSNWRSIHRKQSEAGMHAGVTGWQSMTWKPCSGSGASVSVTGRNGTLAVAGYAILAGHHRGWYGGKGGRSCRP